MKTDLFIEFNGNKALADDITKKAKEVWKEAGNKVKDLKNVELYYKPDEGRCYYVFNGETTGSFEA